MTINQIIREYSKLTPKNIWLDTTGRGRWSTGNCARNWNLTIRTSGICTNQNPEKFIRLILWNFEIQTDHLIPGKRPYLVLINEKDNLLSSELWRPCGPLSENERKQKEKQVLNSYQRTKKAVKYEGDWNTNCNWCPWNGSLKFGKRDGRVGNRKMNWDYPDYRIFKIG